MKFELIIDSNCEEKIIAQVHSASDLTMRIENLVLSYCGADEINVSGDYELLRIKYSDISYISIIDRKLFVYDKDGKEYRANGTLSDIEKKLPNYFMRINKSTIANERYISSYRTTYSGGIDAHFKCGRREYVSRRCFAEIKRR